MSKVKVATCWLDGCSGCHMSFLDLDERLLDVAARIEMVYGPLVDCKEFPEGVDVTLVEGAVSTDEDMEKIQKIRKRTKILVSLGDCGVTTNIPGMRNPFGVTAIAERAYKETATIPGELPTENLPVLLNRVRPIHEVVDVDVFVPGCPPSADTIFKAVSQLLDGQTPNLNGQTRFGA